MADHSTIPTWPHIEALTRPDGSGEVTINGTSHPIETDNANDARTEIITLVTNTAATINRPVHVATSGPDGDWLIVVHPDGRIEDARPAPGAKPGRGRSSDVVPIRPLAPTAAEPPPTPNPPPATTQPTRPREHTHATPAAAGPPPPQTPPPALPPAGAPTTLTTADSGLTGPEESAVGPGTRPAYSTEDLLTQLRPAARPLAQMGWRAWFRLSPSKRELALLADLDSVRTTFARAVTVMVANPKGGGGKTPTSLLIAGEMGHARGGGVVVWDNNELRGNARDRSYFPHGRSVADLLEVADRLERSDASFTELAYFLAHQTHGKYHVLSSDPSGRVVMDQEQVRRVHRILARFFQIIIIDTGNNEKAPNWLAARDLADCLVVPMKWRQDSILVANRMLATMAAENNPLLQQTLLVGTNGPGDFQKESRTTVLNRFTPNHPITEIRTDPHIHAGSIIDRRQLQPRTQRAGLSAAAIVARLCQPSVDQ